MAKQDRGDSSDEIARPDARPEAAPRADADEPAGPRAKGDSEDSGVVVVDEARPDGSGASDSPVQEALPHDDLPLESRPDESSDDARAEQPEPEPAPEPAPEPEPAPAKDKAKETGRLALIVGASLLAIVVAFALFVPTPTPNQWLVFGMLAALGGACVASVLSGFLEFDHNGVKAGGTLAVFVFVFSAFYRFSPSEPEERADAPQSGDAVAASEMSAEDVPSYSELLALYAEDAESKKSDPVEAEPDKASDAAGETPAPLAALPPSGEGGEGLSFAPAEVDDDGGEDGEEGGA